MFVATNIILQFIHVISLTSIIIKSPFHKLSVVMHICFGFDGHSFNWIDLLQLIFTNILIADQNDMDHCDILHLLIAYFHSSTSRKWKRQLAKSKRPSLLRAIIATFWKEYTNYFFVCTFNDLIARLGQPLLLGKLLLFFR